MQGLDAATLRYEARYDGLALHSLQHDVFSTHYRCWRYGKEIAAAYVATHPTVHGMELAANEHFITATLRN